MALGKTVKVLMTEFVTHNVKRFIVEKPEGYVFTPGQATDVAINKPEWKEARRPFTFTSLTADRVLEFTIKGYPERHGVTEALHQLEAGEELILSEPFGTIQYKSEGVFIAGGAGITPFIAIFRELFQENRIEGNRLIFSNQTAADIILEKELKFYFNKPGQLLLTLTSEKNPAYLQERITKDFLEEYITNWAQPFYLCGPPAFTKDIKQALVELGAPVEELVFEK
ncbi:FAD-binding oxidoreductase [Patescibacteria group bacterium]|nr:FAD-binding oxidoreductase [Patescibacteria group bacterium]